MAMNWTEATDLEISYLHTNYVFLCLAIRRDREESVIVAADLQIGGDRKVLDVHYHVGLRNMMLLY
jgi:hypothetical protein